MTPLHASVLITRFNCLTSGTKEANTNSASISDDNAASLWRGSTESEPAVKQKGKREAGHPRVPHTGCPGVIATATGSQASDPPTLLGPAPCRPHSGLNMAGDLLLPV